MNINVSVGVFPAPGLSIDNQRMVNNAMSLFLGKTVSFTNLSSTVPISNMNLINLLTTSLIIPDDIVQRLILLRVNMNGKELDLMKSLTDNGVSNNNLLNVHLIAK